MGQASVVNCHLSAVSELHATLTRSARFALRLCRLQRINADESRLSPRRTISLSIRSRWRFRSHRGGTGEQQSSVEGLLLGRLAEATRPTAREACSPSAPGSSRVLDPDLAPIAWALGSNLGGRIRYDFPLTSNRSPGAREKREMDGREWSATRSVGLALDAAAKNAAEAVRKCGGRPVERFLNRFLSHLMEYPEPRHDAPEPASQSHRPPRAA